MTSTIKRLSLLAIAIGFLFISGFGQLSNNVASYANYKLEEKKTSMELYNMQAARKNIEMLYQKMGIAQQNVDVQMLLSVTHPDFKAGPVGDVWDYKRLEMYWAGGLKQIVSTEATEFNIKSFILKNDTAVVRINQVWKRRQWMAGEIRNVSTDTDQTETWVHTTDGWKKWRVTDVSNGTAIVNGKRVDISKPYDPDAPDYKREERK